MQKPQLKQWSFEVEFQVLTKKNDNAMKIQEEFGIYKQFHYSMKEFKFIQNLLEHL